MSQEKPFEPTESRIERAKREGDSARSQEVCNVASFAAGILATSAVAAPLGSCARAALMRAAGGQPNVPAMAASAGLMLFPAFAAGAAAMAAGVYQSGGLRVIPAAIKFERLAPAENMKRMFSRESLLTAARATVGCACAGAALIPAFAALYAAALHSADVRAIASAAWNGALRAAGTCCVVGAVFAAADYGVQLVRWRKRLRMSFEELKRDRKEHDGDPLARSRRRMLHGRIARGSLRKVKDAAFVLTNPTHIAIALEYRPPAMPVPRVLVRAADAAAARVRELAALYGIPVVEHVPLARALYAGAQPGDCIPQDTYLAVAHVVTALAKSGAVRT